MAKAVAYGSSQARSQIITAASGLHHSHSNMGSLIHWVRPGIKPSSSWIRVRLLTHCTTMGTPRIFFKYLILIMYYWNRLTIWGGALVVCLLALWPHPWHPYVPAPGVESEKQLWPIPQLRQCWILNLLFHSGNSYPLYFHWIICKFFLHTFYIFIDTLSFMASKVNAGAKKKFPNPRS